MTKVDAGKKPSLIATKKKAESSDGSSKSDFEEKKIVMGKTALVATKKKVESSDDRSSKSDSKDETV